MEEEKMLEIKILERLRLSAKIQLKIIVYADLKYFRKMVERTIIHSKDSNKK
jgi:hypothetical protein